MPSAPSRPARFAGPAIVALLCGLHAWGIYRGSGRLAELNSPWPIARDDHPMHLHNAIRGAEALRTRGVFLAYDPSFMAGYVLGPVADPSGTLFVDVSCDEGMAFSWARPTTFVDPMFEVGDGLHHYAVDHSPSYLWSSSTWENSEALLAYLPVVAGGPEAWEADETIRRSVEIRDGVVVCGVEIDCLAEGCLGLAGEAEGGEGIGMTGAFSLDAA